MGRRRSLSRSGSRSPVYRVESRYRDSESPVRNKRSVSRGSYSKRRTPPSPSPRRRRSFESRSRSPYDRRGGEYSGGHRGQPRRLSKPPPSRCLGVFGMSIHTDERCVKHIMEKFGPIEHISMITCTHTGRFRGYCFVYFDDMEDAKVAKDHCNGMEIDGRRVRVDYSYTTRAHTPTPGQYKGKPHQRRDRGSGRRDYYGGGGRSRYRSRSRSRSYGRRGRYSRSRSR